MEEFGIQANGYRVCCRRWACGRANAPTVLALHGFTGSGLDYLPIIDRTRNTLNWVTVDLPGHGASQAPECVDACTSEALIALLRSVEMELELSDYALLGYSMGARLSLIHI